MEPQPGSLTLMLCLHCSTETALVKVKASELVLWDLRVDHNVFLQRLERIIWVTGAALSHIYLTDSSCSM